MEEGKRWFFIACFCNDDTSERHHSEYGRYCLRVPTSGDQVLAGPASGVTCALQPIVYDTQLQRESLEEIVVQSMSALAKFTRGENEGLTSKWNVDFCAKIIAHHLLSFALAFKRPEYEWEQEWRMVCSPKMNPLHTAQSMLKAEFEVHIKAGTREHIDLRLKTKDPFVSGAIMSPVPVTSIKVPLSPSIDGDSLIRKTLKLYRYEDIFP